MKLTPKIHLATYKKVHSHDFRTRYKALRGISSRFIRNAEVKAIIYEKCNGLCYICGSTEKLQIDHVISVYEFAKSKLSYEKLNSYENLMLACAKCNAGKTP